MDFFSILNLLLLIFGFGFVIFWHELGHFIAAKWAGVKVEQFAVGFGQALLCWRKGIGVRFGTTRPEYERRAREQIDRAQGFKQTSVYVSESDEERKLDYAAKEIGLGETEYRLNWIPLGGYVKMLGQDDMNPNADSPDPRAYNNKPIGKRMVIISAGVIMNVILAGILFCVLFLWGFTAPSPVVGTVQAGSPAQKAGILAGDRILRFDGDRMHDFTKIRLATALADPSEASEIVVLRDGKELTLQVQPVKDEAGGGFLQIGVAGAPQLQIPDSPELDQELKKDGVPPDWKKLRAGDRIAAINGIPVGEVDVEQARDRDLAVFNEQIQQSAGRAVKLSVRGKDGVNREIEVEPGLVPLFGRTPLNFAGIQPRTQISSIQSASAALGKIQPGDAVSRISIDGTGDAFDHPSHQQFLEAVRIAADRGASVSLGVQRGNERLAFEKIPLAVKIDNLMGPSRRGIGLALDAETARAVVAGTLPDTPAAAAGLRPGDAIVAVNGSAVANWFDVRRQLTALSAAGGTVELTVENDGNTEKRPLVLSADDLTALRGLQFALDLPLAERTEQRSTPNPFIALKWGAEETRDLIVQFYVVLKRMAQQTVSVSNMSGPVGIVHHGIRLSSRGTDWMIWYLAMISANLAVVNFLPLPIVDGGHFMFLLLEKLRGKPVSPRVMVVAQVIGLMLIVGLFLFVTYNDIMRLM